MIKVPFLDLKVQNDRVKAEIFPLWEEIYDSATFIGGRHVTAFEEEYANACSVAHSILVNSGTDALRFILLALGLKSGDEVITVPNTFIATTEAISQAGGKIVFSDIDPDTYNIDPEKLEQSITSRTKGIVPVHLYGQPADMDSILSIAEEHGLWVVEDACQAHLAEYKGRKAGSMGIAGAFSFYPGKNLGGCGEGGAITTNDSELASRLRIFRDHGQTEKYNHVVEGYNGRCDALQAAVLRVKLKYLPEWNETRRKVALYYSKLLNNINDIIFPKVMEDCISVFHLFVIQVENRDAIAEALKQKGISTGLHYPIPLHMQTAYAHMKIPGGTFPVTEAYTKKLLSLPMSNELTHTQIHYVCQELQAAIERLAR